MLALRIVLPLFACGPSVSAQLSMTSPAVRSRSKPTGMKPKPVAPPDLDVQRHTDSATTENNVPVLAGRHETCTK